jgi:hypothetical protein
MNTTYFESAALIFYEENEEEDLPKFDTDCGLQKWIIRKMKKIGQKINF